MLNVADNPDKMVFLRLGECSRLILNALQILIIHKLDGCTLVSVLMNLTDVGVSICQKRNSFISHCSLHFTCRNLYNRFTNTKWRQGKNHANVCVTMENKQYILHANTCSYNGMVVFFFN